MADDKPLPLAAPQMPKPLLVLTFLVAYLVLDRVSFLNALSPLGVTPWNPPPGLGMALMLSQGLGLWPAMPVAAVLAELAVRGSLSTWQISLPSAACAAMVYVGACVLLRRVAGFDPRLSRLSDMIALLWVCVGSALLAALIYVLPHLAAGLLTPSQAATAGVRFWIGDLIGILVLTPLILCRDRVLAIVPSLSNTRAVIEIACQAAAFLVCLAIVFGVDLTLDENDEFTFFYPMFLPLVWVAARHGLGGTTAAIAFVQVGMILAMEAKDLPAGQVAMLQLFLVALATTGLLLGCVVDERKRAAAALADSEARLRERERELAHVSRVTTAGEMASAIAHEVSQPVAAIAGYTRAGALLLQSDQPDLAAIARTLDKAGRQAARAGEVLDRLRGFLHRGERRPEALPVDHLVRETVEFLEPDLRGRAVTVEAIVNRALPRVVADRVQAQQVMLNLLRNAIEAMTLSATPAARVRVTAALVDDMVELRIADNGPGLAPDIEETLFRPFAGSKRGGMGLGLSISRTLIEANGGQLHLWSTGPAGTEFRFTLPTERRE
ncbi:MAG: hypothetical protein OHK0024_25590 [Thalassobaculales bacterium]